MLKYLLIFLVATSCIKSRNRNEDQFKIYQVKIVNYNCDKLERELNYVEKSLLLLEKQEEKEVLDDVMESVLSLGLFTGYSNSESKQKIALLNGKRNLILNNQKNKNCHV